MIPMLQFFRFVSKPGNFSLIRILENQNWVTVFHFHKLFAKLRISLKCANIAVINWEIIECSFIIINGEQSIASNKIPYSTLAH